MSLCRDPYGIVDDRPAEPEDWPRQRRVHYAAGMKPRRDRSPSSKPCDRPPRRADVLRHFLGSPLAALLGALLLAAWAAWVNLDAGWPQALRSGLGQFALSAVLTWVDARVMDWLFVRCGGRWPGALAAATGSLSGTYALVICTHRQLDTPHILVTLLPGLVPTIAYTLIYTALLLRGHHHSLSSRESISHV